MTPEGRVKKLVKAAMAEHHAFMPVQTGRGRKHLDFIYCVFGRYIAVETKAEGKQLTALQYETASDIARSGGTVFVVRNQQDIDGMMLAITYWASRHVHVAGSIKDKLPPMSAEVTLENS